ncbi:fibronectin type III domain-containing protein [Runella sp. SP2]|uniref:fibronectin type III domain-containing protein n=1 Tax=Runella sp. SP2 TaxID=2268026 RepID=UPI000F07A4E9|nr:hypothetical protein [Runella sp. SP2]AYQ30693.1 hypothetical protein DTQ70_00185 [Runella sp. SP2]
MKKLLLLFLLGYQVAFSQTIITQEKAKKIKIPEAKKPSKYQILAKAKYYGDSVVLRWSANDAVLWQLAKEKGVNIERFEVIDGELKNQIQIVKQLKPWSLAEWKRNCKREDTTAAVIAQLLYGVNKDPNNATGTGSMDAIINQRYDMDNRFFMVNMMAAWHPFHAKGLALRFVDKTIKKNQRYVYQISSPIDPKIMKADTGYLLVKTSQIEPLEKMLPVETEIGDKMVKFKWNKLLSDINFTGYFYERSADNGKTFRRINKKPYLQLSNKEKDADDYITLVDSLPENYKKYIYRIVGINHFGDLSEYSTNILVMGVDLTPPSQVFNLRTENTSGSKVKITWQKKQKESDFIGYVIGRSQSIKGPFEPLQKQFLPISAAEFTDEKAEPYGTNYYVVSAIDTAGNAAISLPAYVVMKDEAAPIKPTGLKGSIDSAGIVKIQWSKNNEPDLLGYMVYKANAIDHVFTPITTGFLADEFFADSITLRSLTKKIYYRVVAFDKSRRASPYSETLELKKPDFIPPVSPVFDGFSVSDSTATLHWVPSSSEDVKTQIVYRKEEGKDLEWRELTRLDAKKNSYIDKNVLPKHRYSYALVAMDDSQLLSEKSFPIEVKPYDSGVRRGVQNLKVTKTTDGKLILLTWNVNSVTTNRILIYRKINQSGLVLVEGLPSTTSQFIDKSAQTGKFQYALKVLYKDGGESLLGDLVSIQK